jgi:hypothetical protein
MDTDKSWLERQGTLLPQVFIEFTGTMLFGYSVCMS